MRKLTDEKIIEALMNYGSVRDAAVAIQCTPQCIYQRMRQDDFKALYSRCRDDAVRGAADKMASRMSWSVDAVSKICQDNLENDPKTSLSAAKALLELGLKYIEVADILRRLEALEQLKPDAD